MIYGKRREGAYTVNLIATIYGCQTCKAHFDLYPKHLVIVPSGSACEYCTDLTGRPNYVAR